MTLDTIRSDFAFLDDWEDRYRYVIELGRGLPPLPEAYRTYRYKVRGTEHLTPQRSNGFAAMVEQIRSDARAMAAPRPKPARHAVSRSLELQRS